MSKNTQTPKPMISVIVTAHNNESQLPTCLDALIAQTYKNIEILCIDDASTDNTAQIIKDYEHRDSRIRGIIKTENIGVSEARNCAMDEATAPYIMFCDGDDYYDTRMCEKMLEKIQHSTPKVNMVISEIRVIYHAHAEMKLSDENYYNLRFSGYQTVNEDVLTETDFAPSNKLFRKELIDKYQLRFPKGLHYEDAYFCAAYMCICGAIYYLNEQLYTYVRRPGSIMSNTWSKKDGVDTSIDHVYIAFQLFDFLKRNNLLKQYNTVFWHLMVSYERLSMNYSRSKQNTKKIREEVYKFIQTNQDYFDQAPIDLQSQIKQMTSQRFAPSKNRMKQLAIKALPTYRSQIQNVIRLRTLKQKGQNLLNTSKQLNKIRES